MRDKDELSRKFEELDFSGEPAMASQPGDDVRRGERLLRRRRAVVWTAGVAAGAVLATSAAIVLPDALRKDATLQVAGGPDSTTTTTVTRSPTQSTTKPPPRTTQNPALPYPATRQLQLDKAIEHLDPRRKHLPSESTGFTGGGTNIGQKLEWNVDGEDGMGMIKVLVTTPGYLDAGDEYALEGLRGDIGCGDHTGETRCEKQNIPGTSKQAWVAPADPELNLKLGVLYERPDGSFVGIAVHDLFGNNTNTPVSDVDVSLAQAFAFVTDPDLKVVPGDDPGDDMGGTKPRKTFTEAPK